MRIRSISHIKEGSRSFVQNRPNIFPHLITKWSLILRIRDGDREFDHSEPVFDFTSHIIVVWELIGAHPNRFIPILGSRSIIFLRCTKTPPRYHILPCIAGKMVAQIFRNLVNQDDRILKKRKKSKPKTVNKTTMKKY